MTRPLDPFEVEPLPPATCSIIWLHGLGASNRDFEDLPPLLELAGCRYVFPSAPKQAVTINGGMVMPAWYDIISLADPPLREDEASVQESAQLVRALIEREEKRGIPAERIILMGFSQGGAMALHVGPRFERQLAGIAVLSGYLLLPDRFVGERHSANANTPVLFCHGKLDPVVPEPLGKRSQETVAATGMPSEYHSFPIQHSISMPEVLELKRWLSERLQ